MKSNALQNEDLIKVFSAAKIGDKIIVNGNKGEQNRVYLAASYAGRKLAMRKINVGWKATVIE